jgi:hypothetical protein
MRSVHSSSQIAGLHPLIRYTAGSVEMGSPPEAASYNNTRPSPRTFAEEEKVLLDDNLALEAPSPERASLLGAAISEVPQVILTRPPTRSRERERALLDRTWTWTFLVTQAQLGLFVLLMAAARRIPISLQCSIERPLASLYPMHE